MLLQAATIMLASVGAFSTLNANAQPVTPPNTALTSAGYLIINQALVQLVQSHCNTSNEWSNSNRWFRRSFWLWNCYERRSFCCNSRHYTPRGTDSVTQGSGAGPIWHNHFVTLSVITSGPCGGNPQVTAITFQQPGRVIVSGNNAYLQGIPSSFTGTDALTGNPLTLSPGHNVQNVVSFILAPIFSGGTLKAVCVEDITPAQHILKS